MIYNPTIPCHPQGNEFPPYGSSQALVPHVFRELFLSSLGIQI